MLKLTDYTLNIDGVDWRDLLGGFTARRLLGRSLDDKRVSMKHGKGVP